MVLEHPGANDNARAPRLALWSRRRQEHAAIVAFIRSHRALCRRPPRPRRRKPENVYPATTTEVHVLRAGRAAMVPTCPELLWQSSGRSAQRAKAVWLHDGQTAACYLTPCCCIHEAPRPRQHVARARNGGCEPCWTQGLARACSSNRVMPKRSLDKATQPRAIAKGCYAHNFASWSPRAIMTCGSLQASGAATDSPARLSLPSARVS